MKLRVAGIPEGGIDVVATAVGDPWFSTMVQEAFEEDYPKGGAAGATMHIIKTYQNLQLLGKAEVTIHPTCGRCLEGFDRHLSVPLQVSLVPLKEMNFEEREEVELGPDDLNFSFYKGEEIDLAKILREVLVLEIPIRYLCSESCQGLCPRCGQSLNVAKCPCPLSQGDPRLAPLKKFLKS